MARRSAPADRHPAVGLDDAPSAAHEEEARQRRAVRADGEEDAGPTGGPERRVDVPVRLLDPDEEAGPGGRLAVDRVEGPDRVARQLDDGHAAGARLVDVLAPLLAQVRPERLLVAGEVDDPAAGRLDRWRRRPPCGEQPGPQGPVGVMRAVGLHLRVDPQVRDAPEVAPSGPERLGQLPQRIRGPRLGDGSAGGVPEGPREGRGAGAGGAASRSASRGRRPRCAAPPSRWPP